MKKLETREEFVLTPQSFFDLLVLCLSFQWEPERGMRGTWSTADKVARILRGLNVLTEKQVNGVRKNAPLANLIRRNADVFVSGFVPHGMREAVTTSKRMFVITESVEHARIGRTLRDYRIYLTPIGAAHAATLEEAYAAVITRQQYLDECTRQQAAFDEKRAGAVMNRYRGKVAADMQE